MSDILSWGKKKKKMNKTKRFVSRVSVLVLVFMIMIFYTMGEVDKEGLHKYWPTNETTQPDDEKHANYAHSRDCQTDYSVSAFDSDKTWTKGQHRWYLHWTGSEVS